MTSPELHRARQLLKAKESLEQRAAQRFAEAQRALREAEARLQTLIQWQSDYTAQQQGIRQVPRVGVLNDWRAFVEGLATQRDRAEAELKGLRAACEERRQAFLAALQDRKTAERYQEHILNTEREADRKREQRAADELASQRRTRTTP